MFVLRTLDAISQIYIVADFQVPFTVYGGIVEAVVFMFEYPQGF